MITEVSIYINTDEQPDVESLKSFLAGVCDTVIDYGLGNDADESGSTTEASSIVLSKFHQIEDWAYDVFLDDILQNAVIAVVPMNPEKEKNATD